MRKFDINSLYCPPYLYTAATLRWEIQKKSFFNSIIHTYFRLFTLSQKKQTANVICLFTVVYCFLFSAKPYSMVRFYLFGQSFSEPPMPTHIRLCSHRHLEERNITF